MNDSVNDLVIRLENGEYNGVDIMHSWIKLKEQQTKIEKLEKQTDREGKLILKMKDDISFYKRKVNNLTQKLESKK